MSFTKQLESVKELIETIPGNTKVEFFNGVFDESVLNNLKLDGNRIHILVGCAGGDFNPNSPRTEINADFLAMICGRSDKTNNGISTATSEFAEEVVKKISKFRGDAKINTGLPVLKSIEELSSSYTNKTNFVVWAVVWSQKLVFV